MKILERKNSLRSGLTKSILVLSVLSLGFGAPLQAADLLNWFNQKDKPQIPGRIVCIWTDATKISPGQSTKRGMGGRVMFYKEGMKEPVKVEGEVTIYAFTNEGADPRYTIPQKKFVFPNETLPLHYSKAPLGHSYSFFVEWDEVGGPTVPLTLIVRFKAKTGEVAVSDASRQTLPGFTETQFAQGPQRQNWSWENRAAAPTTATTGQPYHRLPPPGPTGVRTPNQPSAVQQAAYQNRASLATTPRSKMQVETITIPRGGNHFCDPSNHDQLLAKQTGNSERPSVALRFQQNPNPHARQNAGPVESANYTATANSPSTMPHQAQAACYQTPITAYRNPVPPTSNPTVNPTWNAPTQTNWPNPNGAYQAIPNQAVPNPNGAYQNETNAASGYQPQSRSLPPQFQALRARRTQLRNDHVPWKPSPAVSPYPLGPTPQPTVPNHSAEATPPTAWSTAGSSPATTGR